MLFCVQILPEESVMRKLQPFSFSGSSSSISRLLGFFATLDLQISGRLNDLTIAIQISGFARLEILRKFKSLPAPEPGKCANVADFCPQNCN